MTKAGCYAPAGVFGVVMAAAAILLKEVWPVLLASLAVWLTAFVLTDVE